MTASARKTAPHRRIPSYYEFATHTFQQRLKALSAKVAQEGIILTEDWLAKNPAIACAARLCTGTLMVMEGRESRWHHY